VKTDGIWIFFFVNSYMHKAKIVIVMCFKWVETFWRKYLYMDEEIIIFPDSWTDQYFHSLQQIAYYLHSILFSSKNCEEIRYRKLYFLNKTNHVTRMAFKMFLINITLLTVEYNDKDFEYCLNFMSTFWKHFIELKPYAKITKEYIEIIKQEGGREEFINKYLKEFKEKNLNINIEESAIQINIDEWIKLIEDLGKKIKFFNEKEINNIVFKICAILFYLILIFIILIIIFSLYK
jgi:hypothetical protein